MDIFSPIKLFSDLVTYNWLSLEKHSYLGESLNFFIYDVIKIGLLLILINYIMAITRYYFPLEKVRNILSQKKLFGLDYLFAAILGVVTPFCSCSSIPLFIGFLSAGIPLGVTFTFLIASPLVNEASLYIFPSVFGIRTTIIYNILGIIISILGGLLIQKMKMEKYVEEKFLKFKTKKDLEIENKGNKIAFNKLLSYWWQDGIKITKSVFPYVLLGVAIGALIHGFIPQSLIENTLGIKKWWTIPVATLLGVPLYSNSVSVIPVIEALIQKGIPFGTALSFMTATVTLSIPEALILKKAMKWKLLAMFFGITTFGIMLIGYIFNTLI